MGRIDRRGFLRASAGAAALAGMAACSRGASQSATHEPRSLEPRSLEPRSLEPRSLIDPDDAPFDHVVVLTLSGRSFDHLLGWLPAAGGRQRGLAYRDVDGQLRPTWELGSSGECPPRPPAPEWIDGAVHLGDGAADGFLRTVPAGDRSPLGYYSRRAIPVIARLTAAYTALGNYFASLNAGAAANRLYLHAAATDVDIDGPSAIHTTIWDRLRDAGLHGSYYCSGDPVTARLGGRYDDITLPYAKIVTDARTGQLPHVAFVDPDRTRADDVRRDDALVADVYNALRGGPRWGRTVLVVHYDQWGGYFDHAAPPKVIDANVNPAPGPHPDYSQLGFRVPCVVTSPFARREVLAGGEAFEHCSILRMIEWRWRLPALSVRDRNARNLAEALDFTRALSTIGPIDAPRLPAEPCR